MEKISLLLFALSCTLFSQEEKSASHPYTLRWNTDGWLSGSSVVAGGIAYSIESNLSSLSPSELQVLNKSSINVIDRGTAGTYNQSQSDVSDVLVGISIASPLSLMMDESIRKDYFTLGVMYAETGVLAAIAPSLGKGIAKRIRPYVYNASTPIDVRTESDAQRSFFSRHSTFAFSMAVFMSTVYSNYFPSSKYTTHVWVGSLGLATAVAALRVTSGSHFPTDVIVGAIVGSGIGYFIPYIHRSQQNNLSLSPVISPTGTGVALTMLF